MGEPRREQQRLVSDVLDVRSMQLAVLAMKQTEDYIEWVSTKSNRVAREPSKNASEPSEVPSWRWTEESKTQWTGVGDALS
jgi:hypothetical protein